MNFKTAIFSTLCFLGTSTLVFTACQRERDNDLTEPSETALMERNADDVAAMTDEASTGQISQFKKSRGGCATVTVDTFSNPHKITIDFGVANCLCLDGKNRRGKIFRTFTGKYFDQGSVHTITYDNYFIDDNQLKGIKTVANTGANLAGNLVFTITTLDTLVKANGAGTVSWSSNRTREMVSGYGTPIWGDDKYKVTGTASGVRANGFTWSANITKALEIDHSCKYRIVAGEVQMQPQGKALRTLDYGSGTCDNQAVVTINNKTFNINFK
jgi:hypothetical protein